MPLPSASAHTRSRDAARLRHEVRAAAHVDTACNAEPRIAARDVARGDLHVLVGPPSRDEAAGFGAAPCERVQHARIVAHEHVHRGSDVLAVHGEPAPRIIARLDRRAQRVRDGFAPAREIDADRVDHAAVGCVLNERNASSRRASCAAMRSAGALRTWRDPPIHARTRSIARCLPCHSGVQIGVAGQQLRRVARRLRTWSRRTIARSNVFNAATWRALDVTSGHARRVRCVERPQPRDDEQARPGAPARPPGSRRSRTRAAWRWPLHATLRHVDAEAQRQHRGTRDERGHAEAHERKRDAGQRNHREVAGDRHRELAQREHDPRHGDPAQERLLVVDHAARRRDTSRGSPRVARA